MNYDTFKRHMFRVYVWKSFNEFNIDYMLNIHVY